MRGLRLDALETAPAAGEGGKPLDLPLEVVHEDENQPRTEFDQAELKKLADSIKAKKVHTPVSVRPHPDKPGHYILNFGARRLRASKMAGKATIPAFIDEQHGTFEQVIENTHRDPLKPLELALFFKAQNEAGVPDTEISKRLGIDNATISHHGAFIDMPACLEAAYRDGRCTSARTMSGLRKLHDSSESNAKRVARWVKGQGEITRGSVKGLADKLKPQPKAKDAAKDSNKADKAVGLLPVINVMADGQPGVLNLTRKAPKSDVWVIVNGVNVQLPCNRVVLESVIRS